MKKPITIGIILLLILGVFVGVAITPVAADAVMTINEFQITTDPAQQNEADIYGTRIVWQDNRNGNWDIYMCDLSDSGSNVQITTNTSNQFEPQIYGDYIVYYDDRNGNWDIYMYDLVNHTETQITTNTAIQQNPAIYGNRIVWEDNRNSGNWDVYMYDLVNHTETRITFFGTNRYPAIYGDRIVYAKTYDGDINIYMVDLSGTGEILISTPEWCVYGDLPRSAIYGDRIVYEGENEVWRNSAFICEMNIFMKDLRTHAEWRTTDTYTQKNPDIFENYIVWDDNRNGNIYTIGHDDWDIYVYNLDSVTETRLTNNTKNQQKPAVYGDRIVYQDDRNGNWDIYMALLGWSDVPSGPEPSDTGSLYVASYPSNATILINGTERGYTNQLVTGITAGIRNLTLLKDGYQTYTTIVTIPANDVKVLAPITLTKEGPSPAGTGTLYVASYPTNATILVNGINFGNTNRFIRNVPPGNQNLTLLKDGFQTYMTIVSVPRDGLKVLAPVTLSRGEPDVGCTCQCPICMPGTCICFY
jgi:beta propeller repeat protein